MVSDIANAWKGLETNEKAFEEWLLAEMMRFAKIAYTVKIVEIAMRVLRNEIGRASCRERV